MAKRRAKGKTASKRSRRGRPRPKSTRRAAPARRRKPARTSRSARPKGRKSTAKPRARKRPAPTARPVKTTTAPAKSKASPVRPKAAPSHGAVPPRLGRERRRLSDDERLGAAAFADDRLLSSAKAGHDDLRSKLNQHTETSPVLTGGDIDANWEDAYAVGDEAPGGDNPTPGQDRVDDIGKALGVNYRGDEELKGGDEITERDKHRWELDPASSDDWPHEKK